MKKLPELFPGDPTASERNALLSAEHPKCKSCEHYIDEEPNVGYCQLFSRKGETSEIETQDDAAAYDNFWVGPEFYCAQHSELKEGT